MKKFFFSAIFLMTVFIASAQADSLTQYTGKYKFPDGSPVSIVTVTVQNGLLYAEAEPGSSPLTRIDVDVYSIDAFNGVATFKRNADKKIIGLQIEVQGSIMEGTKSDPASLASACFMYTGSYYSFSRN